MKKQAKVQNKKMKDKKNTTRIFLRYTQNKGQKKRGIFPCRVAYIEELGGSKKKQKGEKS